jgi:hypothetical protein
MSCIEDVVVYFQRTYLSTADPDASILARHRNAEYTPQIPLPFVICYHQKLYRATQFLLEGIVLAGHGTEDITQLMAAVGAGDSRA